MKVVKQLRTAIWIYFILLLIEGALRKWLLPGLSSPLLLVRDPIALWLIFKSYTSGVLKIPVSISVLWGISMVSVFASLVWGHGNLIVALYGARIFILHFPLIFIIGSVFSKEDVLLLGKIMLMITVPVTFLVILQFYSPQTAFVNRGVGGDMTGSGFAGAMGFFRPPGLFSFTNGNALFFSFTGCFVVYFWLTETEKINKLLLLAASVAFLIAIPLSISRALFFQTILTCLFGALSVLKRPGFAEKCFGAIISFIFLVFILSNFEVFRTAVDAFALRFSSANETEGGISGVLLDRFLGGMYGALATDDPLPFFGYGIGMGTNVGSILLSGKATFLIAEAEWGRIIGEMGIVLGLFVILIRAHVVISFSVKSYIANYKRNILPWILISFAGVNILQAQLGQPTALGFSVVSGGLVLAALRS